MELDITECMYAAVTCECTTHYSIPVFNSTPINCKYIQYYIPQYPCEHPLSACMRLCI